MVYLTDAGETSGNLVNPWANRKPNCKDQTGGDWYNIILSASLGGKKIHGCNSSPTCEVLCKATSYVNLNKDVGYIRWDPTTLERPSVGSDISDKFYTHHAYKGSITSTGSMLAYESGLWEPSMRTRARSTSLLAAGIHTHGCSIQDAISTVSTIASDEIDEEAVSSAILPASHLKREMTVVSKANHRVFSKGTIQSGIEWDDSDLSLSGGTSTVAFDWGRVTALARYIAEVNIQACPKFRRLASQRGVPYFIVKDAWAYVSPTDYGLKPYMFYGVPKIDISKYCIPTLKGAFINHEEDVLIAITRSIESSSCIPDNDTLRAYTNIYKKAKKRLVNKRKLKLVAIEDYIEAPCILTHMDQDEIRQSFEESNSAMDALLRAITTRKECDPIVRSAFEGFDLGKCTLENSGGNTSIDELSKIIFDKSTWLLARSIGMEEFNRDGRLDAHIAKSKASHFGYMLSTYKNEIFGAPTHLTAGTYFSNDTLLNLRPHTQFILQKLSTSRPIKSISQKSFLSSSYKETSDLMEGLSNKVEMFLPKVRSEIAEIFREWSIKYSRGVNAKVKQCEANLYFAYHALANLTITDCLSRTTGFIDGSAPERSYIWEAYKSYAERNGCIVRRLSKLRYANAHELALELDKISGNAFKVSDTVKFVSDLLEDIVGDIMMNQMYRPPDNLAKDLNDKYPEPDSIPSEFSSLTDDDGLSTLEGLIMMVEKSRKPITADGFQTAINSYPDYHTAEEYAKVSGYTDFSSAYEYLGEKVIYSSGSEYIMKAMHLTGLKEDEDPKTNRKRGYESII